MFNSNLHTGDLLQVKLEQVKFETGSLKRLLTFIVEENIQLKNRISDILKNSFERRMLHQMETFQNRFIMEDELISLLRNDAAQLERQLQQYVTDDEVTINEINRKLRKLSYNIEAAENHFIKLRTDFNVFLASHI
jgi:hypothetical protein